MCGLTSWTDPLAPAVFRVACYLSDPVCNVREYDKWIQVEDALHSTADDVSQFAKKAFLYMGLIAWASLATFTALPGITLRSLAALMQKQPFIPSTGQAEIKTLPANRVFSLLSWNICGIGAGYERTDGGVVPLAMRMDRIMKKNS